MRKPSLQEVKCLSRWSQSSSLFSFLMANPKRFPMVYPLALSTGFHLSLWAKEGLPQAQIWLPYSWLSQGQFIWSFGNSHLGVILFHARLGTRPRGKSPILYWISFSSSNMPCPFSLLGLCTCCLLLQGHHSPLYLDVPCTSSQTSI